MSTQVYFHVCSTSMIAVDAKNDWYDEAIHTWLCPACHTPRGEQRPITVHLETLPDSDLSSISGMQIGLVSSPLLAALGRDAKENLLLGTVLDSLGKVVPQYSSFVGKCLTTIRGGQESTYRRCPDCGRHLYFPLGKEYLLRREIPDVPIFESQLHDLIVTPDLAARIRQGGPWKHLAIEELPVLDDPLDGRDDLVL